MTKCKPYQILNPSTGRCVKRTGVIGRKLSVSKNSKSRRRKSRLLSRRRRPLKPCKSHQYRDPVTKRCRNKKIKSSRRKSKKPSRRKRPLKPCKSHQYRDPITNRCRGRKSPSRKKSKVSRKKSKVSRKKSKVSRKKSKVSRKKSKVSRKKPKVSRKKSKVSRKKPKVSRKKPKVSRKKSKVSRKKPCNSKQIRNPATGRCVKRDGPVGKKILAGGVKTITPHVVVAGGVKTITPVSPVGLPKEFIKIAEDCSQNDTWEKKTLLGQGAYGAAYEACKSGNCDYVLKSQKDDDEFYIEVRAMNELQSTKVVPKIYAAWTCKGVGYIVMEKLEKCNIEQLDKWKQTKEILDKVLKAGWLHIDTHRHNIMCTDAGKKVVLIDFGWAVKKGPKGDKEKYPNHPLSKTNGCPVSWKYLKAVQFFNFENEYNPLLIDPLRVKKSQKKLLLGALKKAIIDYQNTEPCN